VGLWIERHRLGPKFGLHGLDNAVFVWRVFVDDVESALPCRGNEWRQRNSWQAPRPDRVAARLYPHAGHKPIYRSTAMKVAVVFCGLPDYLQAKLNLPRLG
jgi:hypothetical protein